MTLPTPSLLRIGAFALRTILWLFGLACLALVMVWGGLHFVIVPRIAEFRLTLESQASRALGTTVRIGAIAARSNGLFPSVELSDVSVLDAQGRVALRLPSVLAALSPRSVLGLGFEQLYIDSPVLDVRRSVDGRFWVAGLPVSGYDSTDGAGADWIFSQAELVIRHGTVSWTDELRGAPPLALADVDWVLRNRHRKHSMRLDATPPSSWGARLSVRGVFNQSLLSRRNGQGQQWQGQIYADFSQIDLAQLRHYADLGVDLAQGAGALRAWVDVDHGTWTGATADLALHNVQATVNPTLQALSLQTVAGRLGARALNGGMEYSTQALQFVTQDGMRWPGGNIRLGLFGSVGGSNLRGELSADRLDLAAMVQIASRLPLGDAAHVALAQWAPKGRVEQVQGSWLGPLEKPLQFAAKGRVMQLEIAAGTAKDAARPGVKGLDIDFDFNQTGGTAGITVRGGSLDLPEVFEEPVLPLDQLSGELQWKIDGPRMQVSLNNVRFANADAQGEAQLKWQTGESGALPGALDLQGSLSRALGNRVHRYLPLAIPQEVRHYVRDAVVAGAGSNVKFRVKGALHDFPFNDPKQGEFRISATVQNATYAYAPALVLPKDSAPWPALTQLSGELLIDHGTLLVKGARSGLQGASGLHINKIEGAVNHLYGGAEVAVSAQAQGPLADGVTLVATSPLNAMLGHALEHATVSGIADYQFKLALPIADVNRATVQGAVVLLGNDVQISPDTPRLQRARGTIAFSETGFAVQGGQARALGGDVRIEGGLSRSGPAAAGIKAMPQVLRLQGTVTGDGLRQARELGFPARLAQYATGSSAYTAVLGLRAGVMELAINSSLSGLALNLPAPFGKTAEAALPVRFEISAARPLPSAAAGMVGHQQDQLQLDVGRLFNVVYLRDVSGLEPRVLRGTVGVGLAPDEVAPMPASGVTANINMSGVDLDAWSDVLSRASGTNLSVSTVTAPEANVAMAYLPTSMAVRAQTLTVGGRTLNNVVVGAAREGYLWRANLDASELNGYIEYRQPNGPSPGRLYGRLARLAIGQSTAQEVENLLDVQPASIPALDIVVDDFELRGKKLGRLEIDAVNMGTGAVRAAAREWRLNRFNLITPEAVLTASGNWTDINAQPAAPGARTIQDRRRTVLNFKLDISDAGELLNRFGMAGVVRKGSGKIAGQVAWAGSPITLDYPSLGGNFNVNVENGQFLKADPGIAKLLGVLSLQSLPRRLALDFRDVFSEGFSFDFVRGDLRIEQGIARTNNLQMKGVNAAVLMEGQADIAKETQTLKVVVVPEINAGSASLIATAINPLVGLSTFLAQLVLRKPLIEAATQEFLIDGTWVDPRVTKVEHTSAKPEESK